MSGCIFDAAYLDTGIGLFHDWKMSGVAYNNYADYRVGSPITMHYHKWSTSDYDWCGPFLRIGCSYDYLHESGPFACLYPWAGTSISVLGSGSLFLHTNY